MINLFIFNLVILVAVITFLRIFPTAARFYGFLARAWLVLGRKVALAVVVAFFLTITGVLPVGYYYVRNKVLAHHGICSPDDVVMVNWFRWWPKAMELGLYLCNPGGTVHIPPNYSETFAANLVLKSNTRLQFDGPAAITQGTFQVTCPSPCNNLDIEGPVPIGSNSGGTVVSVVFTYTGNGSSWTLGDSSNQSFNHRVFGIFHDIHAAGTNAIGLDSTLVYHTTLDEIKINGNTGANSQILIRNNGTALAPGSQNFNIRDSYLQNGHIAYQCIGGNSPPTCNMGVISGGEMTGPGSGVAGSIGIDIENGNNNWLFGATVSNYETGVNVASTSANAVQGFYHAESTVNCAKFAATANNNSLWTDCSQAIVDAGGVGQQNTVHGSSQVGGYDNFYGSLQVLGNTLPNNFRAGINIKTGQNTGFPAGTSGGNGGFIAAGFTSPSAIRIYCGDGTGFQCEFAKRTASTDTLVAFITDAGNASFNGTVKTTALISVGTAAALTGTGACATFSTQTGGATAGRATCTGTTGASTLTITPGITAPNGWICNVQDQTTRANLFQQTATVAASCTLTVTSVTQNDVFVFSAIAF